MNLIIKALGLYGIYKLGELAYNHTNYYQQPYTALAFLFIGIVYCVVASLR